uniref:Uncharacterized protein n=1 Tax=Lepeophtheirus salmonis TaxID=72036 RepID=A0A0K2TDU4_LEPSM
MYSFPRDSTCRYVEGEIT